MLEQDFIMRHIHTMVRAILKIFFHIDTQLPDAQLPDSLSERVILDGLLALIDAGDINEAENRLFDLLDGQNRETLKIALMFYARLNEKSDAFLEANGFSRAEIQQGIENAAARFGLGSVAGLFSQD